MKVEHELPWWVVKQHISCRDVYQLKSEREVPIVMVPLDNFDTHRGEIFNGLPNKTIQQVSMRALSAFEDRTA